MVSQQLLTQLLLIIPLMTIQAQKHVQDLQIPAIQTPVKTTLYTIYYTIVSTIGNKAGYRATSVARGWAGAARQKKKPQNQKKSKL